jgi:hypothetical protein
MEQAKIRFDLKDADVVKIFNTDRNNLNYLRRKHKLQVSTVVDGSVESNF